MTADLHLLAECDVGDEQCEEVGGGAQRALASQIAAIFFLAGSSDLP